MPQIKVRIKARTQSYSIRVGSGLLGSLGTEARRCLDRDARRVGLISNQRVFDLFAREAVQSLRRSGFSVSHWLMKEGERHKSLQSLDVALNFLSESNLERNDAVVALGGGVVGDLAGFAAA